MKSIIATISLLFVAMLAGCETPLDVSKTEEYSNNGISFTLPAAWDVTEDEDFEGFRYLSIEGSDTAALIANSYPIEASPTLNDYVHDMVEASVSDLTLGSRDKGTVSEITTTIGTQAFKGVQNTFTISMFGVDVPFTAKFYRRESASRVVYIMSQVATEDLDEVEKGFELVIASFSVD